MNFAGDRIIFMLFQKSTSRMPTRIPVAFSKERRTIHAYINKINSILRETAAGLAEYIYGEYTNVVSVLNYSIQNHEEKNPETGEVRVYETKDLDGIESRTFEYGKDTIDFLIERLNSLKPKKETN